MQLTAVLSKKAHTNPQFNTHLKLQSWYGVTVVSNETYGYYGNCTIVVKAILHTAIALINILTYSIFDKLKS